MYSVDALALSPIAQFEFCGELMVGDEESFFSCTGPSLKTASDRVYDLASLTKVIVSSTLLVSIAQEQKATSLRKWAASQRIAELLEMFRGTALEDTTVLDLWEHRAGLAPVVDLRPVRPHFFSVEESERSVAWTSCLEQILEQKLEQIFEQEEKDDSSAAHAPSTLYSDCGFLVLGAWIEALTNQRLDELFLQWKQKHLLKNGLSFHVNNSVESKVHNVLPTEARHKVSEVNDDKAFFLGGVAPHAGLFGSAFDVMSYARHVLSLSQGDSLWHQWLYEKSGERFCLGWDTASQQPGSPAGEKASAAVRGHLGYTGTALWLDPKSQKIGVLLSNRVVPQATDINKESIRKLRSLFFDGLWQGTL